MQPLRDILSTRLTNRATLLRMMASGEMQMSRKDIRAELRDLARQMDDDARAAGRLEALKDCST
jgi:hypothetical protein